MKQSNAPETAEPKLKKELSPSPLATPWTCQGVFPSNGKQVQSQIQFTHDLDGAWLVKRHGDLPPNVFHDAEYWGFGSAARQFVAFIHDNFGVVRKFTLPSWTEDKLTPSAWFDDKLTWLGEPSETDPPRLERFVYKRDSPAQIEVN